MGSVHVLSCSRQVTGFIMALKEMNQAEGPICQQSLMGETNGQCVCNMPYSHWQQASPITP